MWRIIGQMRLREFTRIHRIGMWQPEDLALSALTPFLILSALLAQAFPLRCSHRREEAVLGEGMVVEVLEGAAPLEGVSGVVEAEAGNRKQRNWLYP